MSFILSMNIIFVIVFFCFITTSAIFRNVGLGFIVGIICFLLFFVIGVTTFRTDAAIQCNMNNMTLTDYNYETFAVECNNTTYLYYRCTGDNDGYDKWGNYINRKDVCKWWTK